MSAEQPPLLSIRRVSRFGAPLVALVAIAVFLVIIGLLADNPLVAILGVVFYLVLAAIFLPSLFRCPRCGASTLISLNRVFGAHGAPSWMPHECPRCGLSFEHATFWSRRLWEYDS